MITKLYPSAADMDLDRLRVGPEIHANRAGRRSRVVRDKAERPVVIIPMLNNNTEAERDAMARRIEMIGDLYEELRLLAERGQAAGLDVDQAKAVLSEFVAPKPFASKGGVA